MALFETKKVTFALKELFIEKADDRWGGVEPYVVPIFYKIDGERYRATFRIFNSLQPRHDSTEVVGGYVQLAVDTLNDTGTSIQEDNPLTYVPPGNLLGRGEFGHHDHVNLSDVSFTTDLIPIPFVIDVLGLPNADIIDALQGLTVAIQGEVQSVLNLVFLALSDLIAEMFGLDEKLETCPPGDVVTSDFLSNIEAQFKCIIPGTVGGVFLCMENDEFSESLARDVRSSLRDEVKTTLNNTINAINETNPIPDPDYWTHPDVIAGNVADDIFWPVVGNIGAGIGIIVLGAISLNPFVAIYGIISSLAWAIGGPDDPIGQATFTVDHSMLEDPAALSFFTRVAGDDNVWYLSGGVTVNS